MKFLLLISLLTSSMMVTAFHPIMIMILIIIQTLTICLIISTAYTSAWFAYILFLIFIGGLMVLFIYITSLAANEKFEFKMIINQIKASQSLILTLGVSLFATLNFTSISTTTSIYSQVTPIFSNLVTMTTILIMTYLLVTLIVAVKISSKMEGPLRNTIKK